MSRFIKNTDGGFTDRLTKRSYDGDDSIMELCNSLWEQTQRFESYSQEYLQRANDYEDKIDELKSQIKELKKVEKLAFNKGLIGYVKK